MKVKLVGWAGRRLECQKSRCARVWSAQCNQFPFPIKVERVKGASRVRDAVC